MKATTMAVMFGSVLLASGAPTADSGQPQALAPCPDSPNCVSTAAEDPQHRIEPLAYKAATDAADADTATMDALLRVVEQIKRSRVVSRSERYLHVEFRTFLGFVDDVEFLLHGPAGTVEFRSASRLGYSDLGVNRKRMERIRELYGTLSSD